MLYFSCQLWKNDFHFGRWLIDSIVHLTAVWEPAWLHRFYIMARLCCHLFEKMLNFIKSVHCVIRNFRIPFERYFQYWSSHDQSTKTNLSNNTSTFSRVEGYDQHFLHILQSVIIDTTSSIHPYAICTSANTEILVDRMFEIWRNWVVWGILGMTWSLVFVKWKLRFCPSLTHFQSCLGKWIGSRDSPKFRHLMMFVQNGGNGEWIGWSRLHAATGFLIWFHPEFQSSRSKKSFSALISNVWAHFFVRVTDAIHSTPRSKIHPNHNSHQTIVFTHQQETELRIRQEQ